MCFEMFKTIPGRLVQKSSDSLDRHRDEFPQLLGQLEQRGQHLRAVLIHVMFAFDR